VGIRTPVGRHLLAFHIAHCLFREYSPRHVNFLHAHRKGTIYCAIIDPATEECLPLDKGARGELVLTNLAKEAQPVVRFRTRDLIEVLDTGPCSCGRRSFRFLVLGRSDDMLVVRGINFFPATIASVINRHHPVLTGEYVLLASRNDPIDRLVLNVEVQGKAQDATRMVDRLQAEIVQKHFLRIEVELADEGTLEKTEGKSVRLLRTL